jgi:Coenzyme PQQ synthesis protein D (PqqD)
MPDFDAPETRSDFVPAIARQNQLLVEAVNDELVVYDLDRGVVHLLNPVGAFVWRHCNGRTTVAKLAMLLRDEYELPADEDVVLLAVNDLEKHHLLDETQASSATSKMFSRRQAIQRLAATAGIGIMFPLIESLNPPTAQAAISLIGGDCTKGGCTLISRNMTVECVNDCAPPCKCRVVNRVPPPLPGQPPNPTQPPQPTCECYRPLPPGSDCGSWDANGNLICRSPCPGRKICRTVLTRTGKNCVCRDT